MEGSGGKSVVDVGGGGGGGDGAAGGDGATGFLQRRARWPERRQRMQRGGSRHAATW